MTSDDLINGGPEFQAACAANEAAIAQHNADNPIWTDRVPKGHKPDIAQPQPSNICYDTIERAPYAPKTDEGREAARAAHAVALAKYTAEHPAGIAYVNAPNPLKFRVVREANDAAGMTTDEIATGPLVGGIKTHCAHCAHKHLTAAYALFTHEICNGEWVAEQDILRARARIALIETERGYLGHRSLAIGFLAAAECLADAYKDRLSYRKARMQLSDMAAPSEVLLGLAEVTPLALAEAHMLEAYRELPELIPRILDDTNRERNAMFLDSLAEAIDWIVSTYELFHVSKQQQGDQSK